MWAFAVLALVAAALLPHLWPHTDDERALEAAKGRAIAQSMAVYRASIVEWARSNPGFDGPVDRNLIAMPAWSRGRPEVHAIVHGRIVAVYLTGHGTQGLTPDVVNVAEGSIWAGFANQQTGTLHSPSFGDTGIEVPSGVPDKAPVWLALRN